MLFQQISSIRLNMGLHSQRPNMRLLIPTVWSPKIFSLTKVKNDITVSERLEATRLNALNAWTSRPLAFIWRSARLRSLTGRDDRSAGQKIRNYPQVFQ